MCIRDSHNTIQRLRSRGRSTPKASRATAESLEGTPKGRPHATDAPRQKGKKKWVFRHECGSPNGFELGFLLLRQRFWAGAAGLWFVPVLRRFFNGSRQFG